MAVTATSFKARFEEFSRAVSKGDLTNDVITAFISAAEVELSSSSFGSKYDEAVLYQAAHLLALSPYGLQMRLVNKEGRTTYGDRVERLAKGLTGRVLLGSSGT